MKNLIVLWVVVISIIASCTPCGTSELSQCGGGQAEALVDLVILIDASGSMSGPASSISSSATSAIEEAQKMCNTNLRVTYLSLESALPSTVFTTSSRDYLLDIDPSISLAADRPPQGYGPEQGANGIEDIANYFDWRDKACRAIFYISDEELDGCCNGFSNGGQSTRYDGTNANELDKEANEVDLAIAAAQNQVVTVFSHLVDVNGLHPDIKALYQTLSEETNGIHTLSPTATPELYLSILPEAICNSCNACVLNDLIQ